MIAELNLTRLQAAEGGDCCSHAFMSLQDLAGVAAARKGVVLQLAERFPEVVLALWRGSDVYQHASRLVDAAQQHVVTAYLDAVFQRVLGGNASNRTAFAPAELEAVRRMVRSHQTQAALFHAFSGGGVVPAAAAAAAASDRPQPQAAARSSSGGGVVQAAAGDLKQPLAAARSSSGGRRLLQQQSAMGTVDTYSSLVAASRGFSNLAIAGFRSGDEPLVTETWLEGPFGWPPKYGTLEQAGQCPAVSQFVESAGEVLRVLKAYYASDFAQKVSRPPWDFASNAPTVLASGSSNDASSVREAVASSSLLYGTALGAVHDYAPWMEESASSFFTLRRGPDVPRGAFTLGNLAHDFTQCSFDNVMFCGREGEAGARMRRNIVVCAAVSLAGWTVVAWFVASLPGGCCA